MRDKLSVSLFTFCVSKVTMDTRLAIGYKLGGDAMGSRTDERVLLQSLAEGDRRAGERLVESTYGRVFGALYKMCGEADLAADLTQETYRRAWQAIGRFEGRSGFSTWLYRIAYTTFLNHVRRPRPVLPLEERQVEAMADERPRPEDDAVASAEAEQLRRVVLGLPDVLRFTVSARFWGELPVREIADLHGVTPVAIRKRLKKAYGIMRLALEEEA